MKQLRTEQTAIALRALAALFVVALLVPNSGPAVAGERTLVRLDGSQRGQVVSGAFELGGDVEVKMEVVGASLKGKLLTDCWLLDARSRRPVWSLEPGRCRKTGAYGFVCREALALEGGRYELYYSTVSPGPMFGFGGVDGDSISGFFKGIFGGDWLVEDDDFGRQAGKSRWGVRLTVEDGVDARPARLAADERLGPNELVRICRTGGKAFETRAFNLREPADVEIYALGEGKHDEFYDYGWLVRSDDRSRPWKMSFEKSVHAGGAMKNRLCREKIALEAGRYEVWYVTDDSHHWGGWNQPPPRDPDFWGISVRLADPPDGGQRSPAEADLPVFPADRIIASVWRPQNSTVTTRMFRLRRGGPVFFYGIGEATGGRYYDWGWVRECTSGEVVWAMDANQSAWAGGARKNRMSEAVAQLEPGEYLLTYVTDDSHSGGSGWNSAPPWDADRAGITVCWFGERPDPGSYVAFAPARSSRLLGIIPAVGDGADETVTFSLRRPATVRVVCQGEGGTSELYDYGWIEREDTGERVWTMTFEITAHAGGARKNREWRGELKLPAGSYRLRYVSDDSHSFNDWNAPPPRHFGADWGIAVYREVQ